MIIRLGIVSFACFFLGLNGCKDSSEKGSRAANKDSMATENSTSSKTSQSVQSSISSSIELAGFDNNRRDNSTPQQPTSTSVFNGQKNN